MRVTIAVAMYVVVIEDDGDRSRQAVPCRKPLDDLVERMRREVRHGRGSVNQDAPEVPGGDAGEPVRKALYEAWCEATSGPWAKPDVLVVNGDAIDGQNRKSGGIGTWSTSLFEQAEHAISLLKMWRARHIYVIRGSGYHVEASHSGLQVEEYIAQKLKAGAAVAASMQGVVLPGTDAKVAPKQPRIRLSDLQGRRR